MVRARALLVALPVSALCLLSGGVGWRAQLDKFGVKVGCLTYCTTHLLRSYYA